MYPLNLFAFYVYQNYREFIGKHAKIQYNLKLIQKS